MDYGKRIKELREGLGMTQVELSERSGVSQEHISRLENGRHNINTKTADKLAAALGVTLNKLFEEV